MINFRAVSKEIQHRIQELLRESSAFNKNDILARLDRESSRLFFVSEWRKFAVHEVPKSILQEAKKVQRESGVNSLCIAEGSLRHPEGFDVPLVLTPAAWVEDKIRSEIQFQWNEDDRFLNPYIEILLQSWQIEIPEWNTLEELADSLTSNGLNLDLTVQCLGNFHHHRYTILKELDALKALEEYSDPLKTILGEKNAEIESQLLVPDLLLAADSDHREVFSKSQSNHVVIQGPPGTGKSQVLTNLIGKNLGAQTTTLVLSEKHVALEVILQKLRSFQLDHLCYIHTSEGNSKLFLEDLENTWNYFESLTKIAVQNIRLSEQYEHQLQWTLDLLNQNDAIGGISLYDFKRLYGKNTQESYEFSSALPELPKFIENKAFLKSIYEQDLAKPVGLLRKSTLTAAEFSTFDTKIDAWLDVCSQLLQPLDVRTWNDLQTIRKQAALCQVLENDLYKQYATLFVPNSKEQRKFLKLYKDWIRIRKVRENASKERSHWKTKPSTLETEVLRAHLEKNGFLARVRFRKAWRKWTDIPIEKAPKALQELEEEQRQNESYSKLLIDFCDLGIDSPEIEVTSIFSTLHQLGEENWQLIQSFSLEKRRLLTDNHRQLADLSDALVQHLNLNVSDDIETCLHELKVHFGTLLSKTKELIFLQEETLALLGSRSSFLELEQTVAWSHWTLFQKQFPAFAQFEIQEIGTKIEAILDQERNESKLFAQHILQQRRNSFERFHELLATPARKLTEEEKQLKARLKKGKALLVKEFSKTRSHPTMRELFASEAREWIQLLKPIWFSNPTQVAKCFPMERDLFASVIFDEASQIPLQHALGALQRSKRGIIAGDSQQMGPTSYFRAQNAETVDLLHQASFHWEQVHLKHHYRSVHPQLIAFSNQHFYRGELRAYPSPSAYQAIHHHFVPDGQFVERSNDNEARAVVSYIKTHLNSGKSLGIVAFSEEQLRTIWSCMDASTQEQLTELIDSDKAFFKALENVQGDECDQLIISFGYAKNEDGTFSHQFGPMNTANGRRRLNVLLTRARERIDFFSSVQFDDFKMSENESVNLLRLWFLTLANDQSDSTLDLPFDFDFQHDGHVLTVNKIHASCPQARELVTFHEVMTARGWKLVYN